jgi:FdhE protein
MSKFFAPLNTDSRPDIPDVPPPPELAAILQTFSALAALRRETAAALPDALLELACDPEQFAAGKPLLADTAPAAFETGFLAAAALLLPRIGDIFPTLAKDAATLAQALAQSSRFAAPLLGSILDGVGEDVVALAGEIGLPPAALVFLTRVILATVLRREDATLAQMTDDALWNKGYCPVCGSAPDIGMLKEKPEPSEFLIAKAGRLSLHCSLCGHIWRFPRLKCPSCDEGNQEKLGLLIPADRERERIHTCATCGSYMIVLNRVECENNIDLDVAPAGLAHLDAVARSKGFMPLCETAWNQFADDDTL